MKVIVFLSFLGISSIGYAQYFQPRFNTYQPVNPYYIPPIRQTPTYVRPAPVVPQPNVQVKRVHCVPTSTGESCMVF